MPKAQHSISVLQPNSIIPTIIHIVHRVIAAVCKQICGGNVTQRVHAHCSVVRADESSHLGVVIAALQIVQPEFGIVIIAAIANRIENADRIRLAACYRLKLAPRVVSVLDHKTAVFVNYADNVTLQVFKIIILLKISRADILFKPDYLAASVIVEI